MKTTHSIALALLIAAVAPYLGGTALSAPMIMEDRTDPSRVPDGFSLTTFNDRFHYNPDAVDEWQSVNETVVSPEGDCEEYAAVSMAYLRKTTNQRINMSVLVDYDKVAADGAALHVVTWTKDGVYSSGDSHYGSLSAYMETHGYDAVIYTNTIEGEGSAPTGSAEAAGGAIRG